MEGTYEFLFFLCIYIKQLNLTPFFKNNRGLAFSQPEKHWKDVRAAGKRRF